jgi:hypothetical protein
VLLAPVAAAPAAEAYNTYYDHRLTYGVHNQYYWVAPGAKEHHPNAIPNGIGKWNATTDTKVYSLATSTKSKSRLDFYRRSTSSGDYCAMTSMYVDTKAVNPGSTNWWWAKVTIDPLLAGPYCGADNHKKGIIAHEQGHAMGLDHNNSSSTLMYINIASTSVNGPKGDDRNGINHLY